MVHENDEQLKAMRYSDGEMPPEERRRHHLEMVAEIARSAQKEGPLKTEFSDYPGRELLTVSVDNYAVYDDTYLYFTLPHERGNILELSADSRHSPLYWSEGHRETIRTHVTLPDAVQRIEMIPRDLKWRAPAHGGEISMSTEYSPQEPAECTITQDIDLNPAIIPAIEYECLLDINRKLSHPELFTIVVRMPEASENE